MKLSDTLTRLTTTYISKAAGREHLIVIKCALLVVRAVMLLNQLRHIN